MFIPQVGALSYGNPKWGVRRPAIARRGLNMNAASVGDRRVHSMGTRRGAGATYSQSRLGSWYKVSSRCIRFYRRFLICLNTSTIDTSNNYSNGDSERVIAKFIKTVSLMYVAQDDIGSDRLYSTKYRAKRSSSRASATPSLGRAPTTTSWPSASPR